MEPGPSILASFSLASALSGAKFKPPNRTHRSGVRLSPDSVTAARRLPFGGSAARSTLWFRSVVEPPHPGSRLRASRSRRRSRSTGQRAGIAPSRPRVAFEAPSLSAITGLPAPARLAGRRGKPWCSVRLQIDHDDADRRICCEIGIRSGVSRPASLPVVTCADATPRSSSAWRIAITIAPDWPAIATAPASNGDDAVVDIGEQLFSGAQIAEAVRAGHGRPVSRTACCNPPRAAGCLVLKLAEA